MVSTRQMCTGSSAAAHHSTAAADAVRFAVVPWQSSSSVIFDNSGAAAGGQVSLLKSATAHSPGLQDMPTEILERILSYESYKRIGQLRLVSRKFNDVCMYKLNSTFAKQVKQMYTRLHEIKAAMPRRESARRNHALAFECDITETCSMRLSLLQMTLGKHIERGHCCFFAGAILDEVQSIFRNIKNMQGADRRPYRVTDELFDLSTMAMEYFKDRIEPLLPELMPIFNKSFFERRNSANDHGDNVAAPPAPPQSNMVLRKGIRKIKQGMKIYNNQLSVLRHELHSCKRKSVEQGKQMAEQQKMLNEQQKQTVEYANRLDANDKKNEEMSRKFSTLLQELNKCKTELQYWRSKSPAMPVCTACGQKMPAAMPLPPTEDLQAFMLNQPIEEQPNTNEIDNNAIVEPPVCKMQHFARPDEVTTANLLASSKGKLKRTHEQANLADNNSIQQKSVIVSPASLKLHEEEQAMPTTAQETKKARRVQKAAAIASASGKRTTNCKIYHK